MPGISAMTITAGPGARDIDALGDTLQRHLPDREVREVVVAETGHERASRGLPWPPVAVRRRSPAWGHGQPSSERRDRHPRRLISPYAAFRAQLMWASSPRRLPRNRGLRHRRPAPFRQPDRRCGRRRARGPVPGHGGGARGVRGRHRRRCHPAGGTLASGVRPAGRPRVRPPLATARRPGTGAMAARDRLYSFSCRRGHSPSPPCASALSSLVELACSTAVVPRPRGCSPSNSGAGTDGPSSIPT